MRRENGSRLPVRLRWRSPVRGPWLTSVLGLVLLIGVPIEFLTGLLSYAAYSPRLGANDPNPAHGIFGLYVFDWLTRPSWLYRLVEGTHVMLGLALVPVLLAKLWSVIPKLFEWPSVSSIAEILERLSLLMLVGGVIFEFSSGILYIDYFGAYRFRFYTGHFFGAWIFIAGFVVHVVVRIGPMGRALRSRSLRAELGTDLAHTRPELLDDPLVAVAPAAPTISRRGVLGLVAGTSLAVIVLTAGESIGGRFRALALLAPRTTSSPGTGANHFPVNNTAASMGITAAQVGPEWRVDLVGPRPAALSRADLLALRSVTADLLIVCTDGWSTLQRWTGVPLADLARLAGAPDGADATVEALDSHRAVTLSAAQIAATTSMLALKVNGADLSLDHGFPARIIVPSLPGTFNTKWVRRISFTVAGG